MPGIFEKGYTLDLKAFNRRMYQELVYIFQFIFG